VATREDLKQIPYQVYVPDELRKALNDLAATSTPVANKLELEGAFGGLVIRGRNLLEYGQNSNQNIINLAANFASEEGPTPGEPDPLLIPDPLIGQTWYDMTAGSLKVYNGSSWIASTSAIGADSVSFDDTGLSYALGGDIQTAIEAIDAELVSLNADLNAHLTDPTAAHAAGAISVSPTVAGQTNVQDALTSINSTAGSASSGLSSHLGDTVDAHDASAISFVAYGSVSSNNVQDAIAELEDEVDAVEASITSLTNSLNDHITDSVDAHDASAISYSNGVSGLAATDVQDAIDEMVAGGLGAVTAFESSDFASTCRVVRTVNLPAAFSSGGPDLVQLVLECVSNDAASGYVTGDIIVLQEQGQQQDEGSGPSNEASYITWNTGSPLVVTFLINYSKGSNRPWVAIKGSTATSNMTAVTSTANFNLRLRAFKFS